MAPLIEDNIIQEQVINFWNKQDFNLELPNNGLLSNCLYCPLKSKGKLLQIAIEQLDKPNELTPESIDWWINIERKYSRDLIAEGRKITSEKLPNFVGFFGPTKELIFEGIKKQAENGVTVDKELLEMESTISCNCTD